jgi:hypothetical protein
MAVQVVGVPYSRGVRERHPSDAQGVALGRRPQRQSRRSLPHQVQAPPRDEGHGCVVCTGAPCGAHRHHPHHRLLVRDGRAHPQNPIRPLTEQAIQWCVTVPSIWDNAAKAVMKNCMVAAGLVNSPHAFTMVF